MTDRARRLPRAAYLAPTDVVARHLLGCTLVRLLEGRRLAGIVVEAEAYVGERDLGAHPSKGRTPRLEAMYGPPGHAYVYFTYGMHFMLNAVTQPVGEPQAVLIRAIEPVDGIDVMRERRRSSRTGALPRERDIANGPGKLCRALGIDRALYGADLVEGDALWIEEAKPLAEAAIAVGPRIGIDYAEDWKHAPLRFWIAGNAFVSRSR